jgi:hypothetical protein
MTYRVMIQPRAEREIENAARRVFTESRSRATALRWVRTTRAKIETLNWRKTWRPQRDNCVTKDKLRSISTS